MRTASDYQTHQFGEDYGLTIEELKLLARAVIVLNADGEIAHKEVVSEVAEEPDYSTALATLRMLL
jgi:thiol peroxidase